MLWGSKWRCQLRCHHCIGVLVTVPAALLPLQIPVLPWEKQQQKTSVLGLLPPTWETLLNCSLLDSLWLSPGYWGNRVVNQRMVNLSLSFHLSLSLCNYDFKNSQFKNLKYCVLYRELTMKIWHKGCVWWNKESKLRVTTIINTERCIALNSSNNTIKSSILWLTN